MRLQFLGCGDAFGSGGRFNTCFHVTAAATRFLVDCGASSMIALRRFGVEPNAIETIFITHLHGDHFGGLPFLILDAQLISRRTVPLTVAGPPGLRQRLHQAMEVLFPGSAAAPRRFRLEVIEVDAGVATTVNGVTVTPFPVNHACGAPPYALRLECDGKSLAYTGDTQWVDTLITAARDVDLFVAEAYFPERKVKFHLDWATLKSHLGEIRPKRLILTHMSAEMLARPIEDGYELASDGMVVDF
jgi:ribonuclease BN (tRNA processing enzyme)